tara:strand:- start:732 stop:1949 length:1218 start_codon:yes stop_codon:yes gene_type:complete
MKILFLTDNFPPETNAPATRTYEHCLQWVKQGEDVTVITCFPNFPNGKVFDSYKNKIYQKTNIDGITVIRVWSYIASNQGFFKRISDFISYAFMAFIIGLFQKTDIIVGTSPQFFTAISARFLAFFKRKPWIMEVRDLWPESIVAVGAISSSSLTYKFLEKIETYLYKSATKIVVVTNSFKNHINNRGVDDSMIHVVTNGVDKQKFIPIPKNLDLLKKYNLEDKFIVSYTGTHGMAHALHFILDCAKEVKNSKIHFIFQGDGAEKQNLINQAQKLKLTNVTFLPSVPKDEVINFISICDVSLVNLKRSDTFKSVIPSKIFENASMTKPILLGLEGESKEIIKKYNAGITFIPENKISFLKALDNITNTENYLAYKIGCNKLLIDFNRIFLAKKMLAVIKNTKPKK